MQTESQTQAESHEYRYGRRTLNRLDKIVSGLLFTATLTVLLTTSTMGTTRDESFYFRYATIYQDWIERLTGDTDAVGKNTDPLGKKDVVETWSQNFEHPSLMKLLFGTSWRFLADKRRPIQISTARQTDDVHVTNLGASDGFAKGDTVVIYGPRTVRNEKKPEPIGTAVVRSRTIGRATLTFAGQVNALREQCTASHTDDETPHWIHGCRAGSSRTLQWLDEITAMRLPGQVFTAAIVAILYLFGVELFGRWAGLFAGLSFLFVPRFFFHGHLCCFDMPVTALIVATVWSFWRSLRSRRWAWVTAILWGLGLLTKLNAFFVPIPLVLAWLGPKSVDAVCRFFKEILETGPASVRTRLKPVWRLRFSLPIPPLPLAFLLMPPVGLFMLYAGWPRLWYYPIHAFGTYLGFHLKHVHYLQQYFGQVLSAPPFPWSYPFVMTLLTVPAPLLLLGFVGLYRLLRVEAPHVSPTLKWLLCANMLFPIVLIAMPSTPIFGGVKHWMASLAFFALIGGLAFEWLLRAFQEMAPKVRLVGSAAVLAITLSSGAYASLHYRDYGTSYYNALAGGIRGAADMRMHRQFWGYNSRLAIPWLNQMAEKGASIAFHNTTYDSFTWYQRVGLLREDLRWTRDPKQRCRDSDLYVFHHQESFAQERIEASKRLMTDIPKVVFSVDDVPAVSIYQCRQPGASDTP